MSYEEWKYKSKKKRVLRYSKYILLFSKRIKKLKKDIKYMEEHSQLMVISGKDEGIEFS